MKMKFAVLPLLLGAVLILSGCVSTVDGHMKAGVPFVRDTMVSRYERTPSQILSAAKAVLTRTGTIIGDNTVINTIQAKVDTRTVWVRVVEIDNKVSEVYVQVRTKTGGDVDLASQIDKQIAIQLTVAR
ncbi:MAG: hypothetical protein JWN25_1145 [Verrucomicrobiales bacterium]|jgi:hypothetical protein|nr:hypothetical protein [Verrucomicrobiales bacterium]MDB6129169.1 hypothetical protein [Verrucomicrobiales bacterium]